METLQNGFTLEIPEGAFPLSTDSMALGEFVKLPKNARVLDLGSGCGTLGLLLCAKDGTCHVTGLELTEIAHLGALENIKRNRLQARMQSIPGDLRETARELVPGSFHICVSNPPYFSGGPESKVLSHARREDACDLSALMEAAGRALRYGGDFYLVHRPERLGEVISLAGAQRLELKRLRLLRHREKGPVTLALFQLRKGGKPGLILEEKSLFHADGSPTEHWQKIYHKES